MSVFQSSSRCFQGFGLMRQCYSWLNFSQAFTFVLTWIIVWALEFTLIKPIMGLESWKQIKPSMGLESKSNPHGSWKQIKPSMGLESKSNPPWVLKSNPSWVLKGFAFTAVAWSLVRVRINHHTLKEADEVMVPFTPWNFLMLDLGEFQALCCPGPLELARQVQLCPANELKIRVVLGPKEFAKPLKSDTLDLDLVKASPFCWSWL